TIRRTGAFTYNWVGDPLAANEAVGLVIGNEVVRTNFQVFLQYTAGSNNLVLPLSQLNLLPVGSSYCQLDRQIETDAPQVTSSGGKIRGKVRARNKSVYIK
ncbi:MAG: hypothetical protein H7Y03_03590, partial [Chitinophagaceae bacterium]|nr:hypothetical protein [Chitinophagaceae bacterium]